MERPQLSSKEQFGRTAEAYSRSWSHRTGETIEVLEQMVAKNGRRFHHAVDIATGTGFAAFTIAPYAERVTATDITPQMLDQARSIAAERQIANITFSLMAAESLQFPDQSADLVICRIAAHHFLEFDAFLSEANRVLEPGGVLVVCDTSAPEDPELADWMNDIEVRRDTSHILNRSPSQWQQALETHGFNVTDAQVCSTWHEMEDWTSRAQVPDDERLRIRADFLATTPAHRDAFQITIGDDGVIKWSWDAAVLRAEKP
jgi:ubiquinone/menaquinone biosynthesis C-methylase UbiE